MMSQFSILILDSIFSSIKITDFFSLFENPVDMSRIDSGRPQNILFITDLLTKNDVVFQELAFFLIAKRG